MVQEYSYKGFTITVTKPQVRYVWDAEGVAGGEVVKKHAYSFYTIGDAVDDAETWIDSMLEEFEDTHRA